MFKKVCPYCNELIDVGKLRMVPRSKKLRWYRIRPTPRTTCPKCGKFVKSTAQDSPVIILVVSTPLLLLISSFFNKDLKEALEMLPGGIVFLIAIVIPIALWIGKRAKLVKDAS